MPMVDFVSQVELEAYHLSSWVQLSQLYAVKRQESVVIECVASQRSLCFGFNEDVCVQLTSTCRHTGRRQSITIAPSGCLDANPGFLVFDWPGFNMYLVVTVFGRIRVGFDHG